MDYGVDFYVKLTWFNGSSNFKTMWRIHSDFDKIFFTLLNEEMLKSLYFPIKESHKKALQLFLLSIQCTCLMKRQKQTLFKIFTVYL